MFHRICECKYSEGFAPVQRASAPDLSLFRQLQLRLPGDERAVQTSTRYLSAAIVAGDNLRDDCGHDDDEHVDDETGSDSVHLSLAGHAGRLSLPPLRQCDGSGLYR